MRVCVIERECAWCVCAHEREFVSDIPCHLCVCERVCVRETEKDRERVCVCVRERLLCVCVWERKSVFGVFECVGARV